MTETWLRLFRDQSFQRSGNLKNKNCGFVIYIDMNEGLGRKRGISSKVIVSFFFSHRETLRYYYNA